MKYFTRIRSFIFRRKILGILLFLFVAFITLVVLLVLEENWRGKRAWNAYVQEHEARGERLDFQPLIPPPVPDEQNFAMTPLLKPLFPDNKSDYSEKLGNKLKLSEGHVDMVPSLGDRIRGKRFDAEKWKAYFGGIDTLVELQKFEPEMREISEAVRDRTYSRFPIEYEKGFACSAPHLGILMKLSKLYTMRASAELQAGQADAARADTMALLRLAQSLKDEPLLISQLVRMSVWHQGVQVIWEGLQERRWTDAQIAELQAELGRADFLEGILLAFHGERAGSNITLLTVIDKPEVLSRLMSLTSTDPQPYSAWRFIPSGVIYQNMLEINRYDEKYLFPSVDPKARRIKPELFAEAEKYLIESKSSTFMGIWIPQVNKMLAFMILPSLSSCGYKAAYEEVSTGHAMIACALERYRLANGQFPDALDKLVPAYLKVLPEDVLNGELPHYRLNGDGTYLLYSNGINGKDDGGTVILKSANSTIDIMKSDWVWAGKEEAKSGNGK